MLGGVRWCSTEWKGLSLVNQAGPFDRNARNKAACRTCCWPMRSHRAGRRRFAAVPKP
jgi:hypothetical protein